MDRFRAPGRGRAPAGGRILATVLFTDIVGSTELAARVGDRAWRDLVAQHHAAVRRELRRFGAARWTPPATASSPRSSGPPRRCAAPRRSSAAVAALGLQVRAGVHTGEVELDGRGVGGIAVHIGARVAARGGRRRGARVGHGGRPGRRLGAPVRGSGGPRPQGRAGGVAAPRPRASGCHRRQSARAAPPPATVRAGAAGRSRRPLVGLLGAAAVAGNVRDRRRSAGRAAGRRSRRGRPEHGRGAGSGDRPDRPRDRCRDGPGRARGLGRRRSGPATSATARCRASTRAPAPRSRARWRRRPLRNRHRRTTSSSSPTRSRARSTTIDTRTNAVTDTRSIRGRAIAVGFGSLWLSDHIAVAVTVVNPHTLEVDAQIPLPPGSDPGDIVATADAVWVADRAANVAPSDRSDRASGGRRRHALLRPTAMAWALGSVWVTSADTRPRPAGGPGRGHRAAEHRRRRRAGRDRAVERRVRASLAGSGSPTHRPGRSGGLTKRASALPSLRSTARHRGSLSGSARSGSRSPDADAADGGCRLGWEGS